MKKAICLLFVLVFVVMMVSCKKNDGGSEYVPASETIPENIFSKKDLQQKKTPDKEHHSVVYTVDGIENGFVTLHKWAEDKKGKYKDTDETQKLVVDEKTIIQMGDIWNANIAQGRAAYDTKTSLDFFCENATRTFDGKSLYFTFTQGMNMHIDSITLCYEFYFNN